MMKKLGFFSFLLLGLSLLRAVSAHAAPDPRDLGWNGGLNENPHNLSNLQAPTRPIMATSESRICIFCHTPHGATPQSTLWNRPDPAHMGSFHLYGETTGKLGSIEIDNIAAAEYDNNNPLIEYPNGASKLCLSCHDGATSIGTLVDGTVIAMNIDMLSGRNSDIYDNAQSGRGIDRTHPFSFVYRPPSAPNDVVNAINSAKPGQNYKFPDVASEVRLDGKGRMQCTTCHNPHFDTKEAGYILPFWANHGAGVDDKADYNATCLECHSGGVYPGAGGTADMHNL